ncbi:glycoside hydrolase family 2 protein [Didymella exigua CBS 183.55]|uniref:Glycoside hydrolase family 2 protein n=1 Tax=Didymella exigua CBS 183.55 TaxID=1150837 RepID=A0A6A5S253_9PLEO|nr:glycoside hydrolase family 2 protein [Didymella exigua CBS 183.55]KAF1933829.1 glycoside hydrolase family 2 protein [Didymella exigua CBS 183.55]
MAPAIRLCVLLSSCLFQYLTAGHVIQPRQYQTQPTGRQRISINDNWRFWRSETNPDGITYDNRTDTPQQGVTYLRPYILPSANDFIVDPSKHYQAPSESPPTNISYTQNTFDDSKWESVTLPHDWAINGPFYEGDDVPVTGGMGRLPIQGVGWYRKKLTLTAEDTKKVVYLDIDGAQSYAIVWLNGNLVGGWPYGYNSFRLDLTPFLKVGGGDNHLAIRLDNPIDSARWYPGGGLYRSIWLTKVESTHVAHWGTYITTKNVSSKSATLDLTVQVKGDADRKVDVVTEVYTKDGEKVAEFPRSTITLSSGSGIIDTSVSIDSPRLWGPPPTQKPNLYTVKTHLFTNGTTTPIDTYETSFGIRAITYKGDGLYVNGERIRIQGVNQHSDLGAIGMAFNTRAAERQLEHLHELGVNAVRMSHNPPAPELLHLTDRMGFLVVDEVFDSWERKKTDNDFHLIFPEWHEADLRSMIRRDRNHPSIYAWSIGNEVGEQTCCGERGFEIGKELNAIVAEEDPTRPSTASMNVAKPNQTFPENLGILSLNYQGEGIRDTPAYSNTNGTRTPPQYQPFHDKFPDKLLQTSEAAAQLSSRGTYIFPVTDLISAPVNNTSGGNSTSLQVSSYELHTANFGSSVDKVFAAQDSHPFVAGEFVWSGWDYIGEPEPYYSAKSSYYGIIDLAGFPKDRYYLYQSKWRPDLRMAHILPHWNWPDRVGQITPVHVFTSGDEAELFMNGKSLGRKKKGEYEYRLRWNDIVYEPGELHVVAYRNGTEWATANVRTTGAAARLQLTADRAAIAADGKDLSFVTLEVLDAKGDVVRDNYDAVTFSVSGPGEIVATDNGNSADLTPFPSLERKAFSGLALAIVKAKKGESGAVTVTASGTGLQTGSVIVNVA